MIKKWIFILLVVLTAAPALEAGEFPIRNMLSIKEINSLPDSFGTYHLEGYVIFIAECPPCPEEAFCEPCPPSHIIVSHEEKEFTPAFEPGVDDLLIIAEQTDKFRVREKYRFLVQVLDARTFPDYQVNTKLIYSIEK